MLIDSEQTKFVRFRQLKMNLEYPTNIPSQQLSNVVVRKRQEGVPTILAQTLSIDAEKNKKMNDEK